MNYEQIKDLQSPPKEWVIGTDARYESYIGEITCADWEANSKILWQSYYKMMLNNYSCANDAFVFFWGELKRAILA